MRHADPLAQAAIDRLEAENAELRAKVAAWRDADQRSVELGSSYRDRALSAEAKVAAVEKVAARHDRSRGACVCSLCYTLRELEAKP